MAPRTHNLTAFHTNSIPEQERVVGRTKAGNIELTGTALPSTAHLARVQIHQDGQELPIYRRSVPCGTVTEHGLYFVAFSADRPRYDRMLVRMFGATEDGVHDHLTDFSRPVSGACYFAPSLSALNDLAGPEDE